MSHINSGYIGVDKRSSKSGVYGLRKHRQERSLGNFKSVVHAPASYSNQYSVEFDGTNDYSEVTSGNYTVRYKGVHEISTYEYVCNAASNEFNQTQNETIFKPGGAGKLKDHLTGSLFPTYITEVGLYDDAEDLIGIARLSQAIPKSRKIPMRFFVRMDY